MSGDTAAEAGGEAQRKAGGGNGGSSNRIQVSNTKKPLFFYVNLAKRYMQQHDDVNLSALGMGSNDYIEYESDPLQQESYLQQEEVDPQGIDYCETDFMQDD